MNDDDINKLAAKLTESLVTKDEFKNGLNELKAELKSDIKRVENEVKSIGQTLVNFIDEIDPKVEDHGKRLTKIESLPSIAQ